MKGLKFLRVLGAVLMTAGAVGLGAGLFAGSAMIVAVGVRALTGVTVVSVVALCMGAAALAGGTVPQIAGRLQSRNNTRLLETKKQAEQKNLSDYAKDSLNPEKTRARLEQLKNNNGHLTNLVGICLRQMDRIDTYQERHKSLLDANEAIYLEDTIEVIDESERRMCRNFRNIINCCILIEDTDSGTEELDSNIINAALADNEEELASVSTLLKYSVAYINNYNRNGVKDRSELDAWLKIMKASMGGGNEKA